uniref:Uncharacterized protein n=1 Tax=Acrobeloides nanus TaxID=290746 RepID=A0A914C8R3_9BILA
MYVEGENPNELVAGHPPAAKVSGGMRVTTRRDKQNRSRSQEDAVPKSESEESTADVVVPPPSANILAHTGLAAVTKRDFPEEAVRAYHDKPIPSKQDCNRPWAAKNTKNPSWDNSRHIFQPRRFNTSGRKDLPHNSSNKIN